MDWGGVEDELDGCRRAALINLEPTRQRLSAPKGMMANTGFGFGFDEIRFGASSADVLPVDTVPPTLLTITGITNGVSQGGTATWDNGTTTNWDRGPGFEAPIAWDNTGSNTAMFGGTAGTVTLAGEVSLSGLTVNLPSSTGSGYFIGDAAEDNALTFTGTKTMTTTATGTNQDVTIRAGIAGSPTMNSAGRATNSVDNLSLLPGSGVTQTIGTLNMLNTFASNKRLILGGTSTGNLVDTVTWAVTANQLFVTKAGTGSWTINNDLTFNTGGSRASRLYVEQGTLTLGGTANFFTHKVRVSPVRESTFTATNLVSKLVAKGTFTIGDNREFFYVQNAGTISPGPGVQTLAVSWNANSATSVSNGAFNMQTGSTYEWDVASSNLTLVPNANIVFGGSGASRTVTVTPVSGLSGTATITITLTDNGSLTASDTFTPSTPVKEFARLKVVTTP